MITPADLDPVIHAPKRLAAMAILCSSARADFGFLKSQLQLSDSDLSKQMTALSEAGYVKIIKTGHGRTGSTSYQATRAGTKAYQQYRANLIALMQASVPLTDTSAQVDA